MCFKEKAEWRKRTSLISALNVTTVAKKAYKRSVDFPVSVFYFFLMLILYVSICIWSWTQYTVLLCPNYTECECNLGCMEHRKGVCVCVALKWTCAVRHKDATADFSFRNCWLPGCPSDQMASVFFWINNSLYLSHSQHYCQAISIFKRWSAMVAFRFS